jgi:hypothetical protein
MARLFTLDEAIALLPTIQPILHRIMDLRIRLERAERDTVSLHWKARTNGHVNYAGTPGAGVPDEVQSQRTNLRSELNAELVHLRDLGVELKDPALGLIDFRSLREGRVVYLCWRLGEPTVAYWHDLDAGFASRQPL